MESRKVDSYINEIKRSDDLRKISLFPEINQYFDREIFYNLRLSGINSYNELITFYLNLREKIIELENPYLLMKLDLILLQCCHREVYSYIKEDINVIVDLLNLLLQPFFDRIDYQLKIENKFRKEVHNFNNDILASNCESVIEIIRFLLYFDNELRKNNIHIDIIGMFYQQLGIKELSFIYAQLSPNRKNGYDYPLDKDREHRDRLYNNLWKRDVYQLQQFISYIVCFYYANTAEGIIASFVKMLQQYSRVQVCEFMHKLNFELNNEFYDFSAVYDLVDNAERIIEIRQKDKMNGHVEIFFDYLNGRVQMAKDRQYNLHLKF